VNDRKTKIQNNLVKARTEQLMQISKQTSLDTLKAVEDKLLADSTSVVVDCLGFADLAFDPETYDPIVPAEWNDLPESEKARKIRLAKAVWMPSSDVPHGVKMAQEVMIGILKTRAAKETGTRILNIENASFPAPSPLLKELDIIDVDE
jgi:hypothetical protein